MLMLWLFSCVMTAKQLAQDKEYSNLRPGASDRTAAQELNLLEQGASFAAFAPSRAQLANSL